MLLPLLNVGVAKKTQREVVFVISDIILIHVALITSLQPESSDVAIFSVNKGNVLSHKLYLVHTCYI